MTDRLPRLRALIHRTPWAIMPGYLEVIVEVVSRRAAGIRLTPDQISAIRAPQIDSPRMTRLIPMEPNAISALEATRAGRAPDASPGNIAVIPVRGVIAQHSWQVDDISGPSGTSTERLTEQIRSARADPTVKSIVMDIDSPGGSVYGVQEAADAIFAARGSKPIIAQVNAQCGSAACWLATAADEIVVTPSGEIGSIGVYGQHIDISQALDREGQKMTLISAGKYKTEGNPFEPLTETAAAAMQQTVNRYYGDFTSSVARGRGVSVSTVTDGFGEGRMVGAKEAVRMGLADRVGTMEATLKRLGASKSAGKLAALTPEDELRAQIPGLSPQSAGFQSEIPKIEQESAPKQAETSPTMDVCSECGQNCQLGANLPVEEGEQSSLMEKCPKCGTMREPPSAGPAETPENPVLGGDSGENAAPEPVDTTETVNTEPVADQDAFRRRRFEHRRRSGS